MQPATTPFTIDISLAYLLQNVIDESSIQQSRLAIRDEWQIWAVVCSKDLIFEVHHLRPQ